MLTIGYGDISPVTNTEILVWIFIMFSSTGIFGYTLNTINHIFFQIHKDDEIIK